ncbi:LRIF1 factor, partial [Grallaria varia]|nr:LRIF1 factor [Grallaria varia]
SSVAGCVYRVLQISGPDGKNLLKLLPLPKPSGSSVPPVPSLAMPNNPKENIPSSVRLTFKTQLGNSSAPSTLKIFQSPNPGKIILTRTLEAQEGARAGTEKEGLVPGANTDPMPNSVMPNSAMPSSAVPDSAVPSSAPQPGMAYMLVNTKAVPAAAHSPALPLGHHLQIPADAEVKSVPASLLPAAIQQKILAAATTSGATDGAKSPTVIYVSPVNTVRTPPKRPEGAKAVLVAARGGGAAGPPRRRQSPMKWIVQEAAPLSTPCLIPVKSSNDVATKILRTLSDAENAEANVANVLPPCPGAPAPAKIAPLKDNALVMYKGKVYLLTKRGSAAPPAQPGRPADGKALPKAMDSSAVNKITSKVVNLVLSKSKTVTLPRRDPQPPAEPPRATRGHPKGALVTPGAEQQDPCATPARDPPDADSVSSTTDIAVPAAGAQGGQHRGHPARAAAPWGEQEGTPGQEGPKIQWEHVDSLGKGKTQPQEQPHQEQDLELRKKFGLFKEERVCLRRIPLVEDTWMNPEERSCSSDSLERKSDSCSSFSLDVEIGNHLLECVKEEKIPVDLEEDFTRKRKTKSCSGSDGEKRRRTSPRSTSSPSVEPTHALPGAVSPPPASPEPGIPTGSSGSSQGTGWEPDTPPECREGPGLGVPLLVAPGGDPSLPEGSFRDDAFPAAPPDLDETIRDEKIRRLKQLLREREAALEEMRRE